MSRESMKKEIEELFRAADKGASMKTVVDGVCEMFRAHPEELKGVTYSYRLCASDTGYVKAFSLVDGQYVEKTEMDEADVIVTGTESNILAVLKRTLSPMSALLRGKIKVSGSKAALIRLAEFL